METGRQKAKIVSQTSYKLIHDSYAQRRVSILKKKQRSRPRPEVILIRSAERKIFVRVLGRIRSEVCVSYSRAGVKALKSMWSIDVW